MIRHVIDAHTSPTPAVLEIPSKDHPYDASKDSILRRAKVRDSVSYRNRSCQPIILSFPQGMFNPDDMVANRG